ncbi:MAG: rhomboid family intramembrane serine protease [Alphaproteobacteria bacterium]|nr:rhomboid family intramembrane serine protease [Alphaproteobacteria bacterium]
MRRPALLIWTIIIACALVFLWQIGLPPRAQRDAIYQLGVIPAVLFGEIELPRRLQTVPGWASILTSMFLHGGWLHIIGNMLYLWIFGSSVEDAMSRPRFLVFYLLCGTAAALGQSLGAPHSTVPMIGASGAIAGVLGAHLLLHPRANVRVLVVFFVIIRFVNLPAVLVLGLWFVLQLTSGASVPTDAGGVAFMAHVSGFIAGMLLIPFFKDREVPFFGGPYSASFAVARSALPRGTAGSVPSAGGYRRSGRGPWG